MGPSIRLLMALAAGFATTLVITTGPSKAAEATASTALSLREGPGTGYARLLTMPAGARVHVKGCRDGWCKVNWDGYAGFASQSGLLRTAARGRAVEPEVWPVYPPYPYRAGHYPKVDWYDDMPPYTAISPSFYRKRFFMMAQERDRYRYMPHIFSGNHGSDGYYGGDFK